VDPNLNEIHSDCTFTGNIVLNLIPAVLFLIVRSYTFAKFEEGEYKNENLVQASVEKEIVDQTPDEERVLWSMKNEGPREEKERIRGIPREKIEKNGNEMRKLV
jgi:hypothetical protein